MLKPNDPGMTPPPGGEERPVGELVHQLVEDGKAYAQSELKLVKTIASAKAGALALPAALFGTALVLGLTAVNALAVGIVLAIADALGGLLAGLITFLLFGAIAGGLAWWAMRKFKDNP